MGRLTVPPQLELGNQFCEIEEHHRTITIRENTVSHHKLIVWQWLLSDMLHYLPGRHRETIKTMKCMTQIMRNTKTLNCN